ncbi:MAG TPA: hypothetical protein VG122_07550 [Gemmata sp.]|nr:hypothetical protein [Gemmata sp.]
MTTATAPTIAEKPLTDSTRDILKRAGNPFRNYFARNPDDEVCARYHVPELFAAERDLLHSIIDLYRYDPLTHSEVVPVLGNKGAGKTHLLHSIKHGSAGAWQLLVTPGVYQKDTEFLEYLLYQIIDTLLGGGKQKGIRPLEQVGDQLVRRILGVVLRDMAIEEKVELFPPPGLGRWGRMLGLGTSQAKERAEWLAENLSGYSNFARMPVPLTTALHEAGLSPQRAFDLLAAHVQKTEAHNTAGLMRRHIYQGFAKAALLKDEADLASFLTYGFAELEFHVRPTRQDLVLALFKVIMEVFRSLKTPVVVAFDQLEDLLLARRSDDAHRTAESFFAGIVQVMHQIDGLCFLIFAERGLWNRFVPSLDGYIQDRLNNPVHVPKQGTVKAIRLEAPSAELFRRVVEARLRPCLDELPTGDTMTDIFPFSDDQVLRIARTEPTLRDMLQQCRHLFDHLVYGPDDAPIPRSANPVSETAQTPQPEPDLGESLTPASAEVNAIEPPASPEDSSQPATTHRFDLAEMPEMPLPTETMSRITAILEKELPGESPDIAFKSVTIIESPGQSSDRDEVPMAQPIDETQGPINNNLQPEVMEKPPRPSDPSEPAALAASVVAPEVPSASPFPAPVVAAEPPASVVIPVAPTHASLLELWDQEQRAARRKLEPEGALTGATRELQAGLGAFLTTCHEHGVKVGPWRLQHVVPEWTFGEHPTYGAVTIAHWACKDGQPWKLGLGLFLARGAGKPKDLEIKLSVMETEPVVVDYLILLRPEDDLTLTAKSKSLWQEAERRGKHARLEPVSLDGFAQLYSFPRWLAVVHESLPEGMPLPNLAEVIQEKCEKLLEQVCMPMQG